MIHCNPLAARLSWTFRNLGGNYDSEEGTLPSALCTTRVGLYGQGFYNDLKAYLTYDVTTRHQSFSNVFFGHYREKIQEQLDAGAIEVEANLQEQLSDNLQFWTWKYGSGSQSSNFEMATFDGKYQRL